MGIRILHIVTYMDRGGLETMLMNCYRHIDRAQIQFDFLVHREFRADYDDEIEAHFCSMDLDEDEMERFLRSDFRACPFYRRGDDYSTARRQ